NDDVVLIRDEIRAHSSEGVNVIVASTHTHSSIDTLGIYGPDETQTGLNDEYQAFVRAQAVEAAVAAISAAQPAIVRAGRLEAPDGYNEFDRNRHAGSFDDGVTSIRFDGPDGALGTIVNWASHPELIDPDATNDPAIARGDVVISSDYVHTLRTTVEAGGGGTTVFVNGPIGAVTALAMPIVDPDTSEVFPRRSVAKARHVGAVIGRTALDAVAAPGARTIEHAPLVVRNRVFDLRVNNPFILAIRAAGTLQRQLYVAGVPAPFGNDVRTEMTLVRLGPIEFLTTPGEMAPDLYTGVYLPEDEQANPDVPDEQPIRGQMTGDLRFIIGLGQDELGYFVAANDYTWPSFYPVYGQGVDRNGVRHYQETLSIGRDTARRLSQIASMLLETRPEPDYLPYPGGFLASGDRPLYGTADADVRGIWIDSSDSGRYERGEDAALFTPLPSGTPAAFGYLDSQSRDIGSVPTRSARGVWIDGDGNGSFSAQKDPHAFFDTYAFGEGQPSF
ncbi:MAG TPA: hypothetical protein VM600_02885, partial [Actinomycetota bacterium]|nr:hypothetical protein [Actinomycetota bacterium]